MNELRAGCEAYREAFDRAGAIVSDAVVEKRAARKLASRVLREEIAAYCELETGLSPGDVLRLEAEFIRGTKTETQVLRGGKGEPDTLVEVPIPAALQLRALEGYKKLAFVPATQHVQVDATSHLSAVVMGDLSGGVPKMDATLVDVTPGAVRLEPVTLEHDEEEPEL